MSNCIACKYNTNLMKKEKQEIDQQVRKNRSEFSRSFKKGAQV